MKKIPAIDEASTCLLKNLLKNIDNKFTCSIIKIEVSLAFHFCPVLFLSASNPFLVFFKSSPSSLSLCAWVQLLRAVHMEVRGQHYGVRLLLMRTGGGAGQTSAWIPTHPTFDSALDSISPLPPHYCKQIAPWTLEMQPWTPICIRLQCTPLRTLGCYFLSLTVIRLKAFC